MRKFARAVAYAWHGGWDTRLPLLETLAFLVWSICGAFYDRSLLASIIGSVLFLGSQVFHWVRASRRMNATMREMKRDMEVNRLLTEKPQDQWPPEYQEQLKILIARRIMNKDNT